LELKNCSWCGKVFAHPVDNVCPKCRQEEEEDFEKVYEYLKKERNASIDDAHEATGVEKRRIIKFVRQGRFISDTGERFDIFVECENCGDPIREGKLCEKCAKTLKDEIDARTGMDEPDEPRKVRKKKERGRMYTADLRRKKK